MWIRIATCVLLACGLNSACAQMGCPPVPGPAFHRFDVQSPGLHGFGSYQSPFAGHATFRPSNYKQAIERAAYVEVHAAQFMLTYRSRPAMSQANKFSQALAPTAPIRMLAEPDNGGMSLIRSIRVAQPSALPVRKVSKRKPEILRAIQREETGPLFPLPAAMSASGK